MTRDDRTSPWVYVGIGCAAAVVLGILAVAGVAFVGYRWAKDVERSFKDPVARTERAKEVLGCEELPEGYHAIGAFRIPFLVEVALLSDREPSSEKRHDLGERGLVYARFLRMFPGQKQELREYLEGKRERTDVLVRTDIRIGSGPVIRRGAMDLEGGARLLYAVQRGRIEVEGRPGGGIAAMMLVECPDDEILRFAIWFGPEPADARPGESPDLAGTPGDEAEIRAFLSHFALCR